MSLLSPNFSPYLTQCLQLSFKGYGPQGTGYLLWGPFTEFKNMPECGIQSLIHDSHITDGRYGLKNFDYNGAITFLDCTLYFH